ncbi:unnamed protein product [Closterium sp. Yama58-4]|nr:unnamed protein product [Closterium sp. Yama58-4]
MFVSFAFKCVTIVVLALLSVSVSVDATASPAAIPAVLEVGRELRNVSMAFAGRYNANADVDAAVNADADARRSSSETAAGADENGDVREGRVFGLHGLRPSMGYEIKISFPASLPARFHLSLVAVNPEAATGSPQEGAAGSWGDLASGLAAKSRKMLDTEKVIFRTDKHSNVLLQGRSLLPSAAVHVWAEPTAVFPGGSREGPENVLFNIVCEELRLGIPISAFRLAAFGIILLTVVVFIAHQAPLISLVSLADSLSSAPLFRPKKFDDRHTRPSPHSPPRTRRALAVGASHAQAAPPGSLPLPPLLPPSSPLAPYPPSHRGRSFRVSFPPVVRKILRWRSLADAARRTIPHLTFLEAVVLDHSQAQPSHRAALQSEDLPSQIDILQTMMARQGRPMPGRQHQKHLHQHATPATSRRVACSGLEERDGSGASSEEERSQWMFDESSSSLMSSTSGEQSTADAHSALCIPEDSGCVSVNGGGDGNGGNGSGTFTEARDIDIDVPDYSLLFNEARAAKTEGKAPRVVPKYGEEMADVPTKRIEVYLPPPSPQCSPKRRPGCCLPLFGRR